MEERKRDFVVQGLTLILCVLLPCALMVTPGVAGDRVLNGLDSKNEVLVAQNDPATLMVGIWNAQIASPFGNCALKVIFQPDGTFTKTCQCVRSLDTLMTLEWGRYTVYPDFVRFLYDGHQPGTYKGRPLSWPSSENMWFYFVDYNHTVWRDSLGGKWDAYRGQ